MNEFTMFNWYHYDLNYDIIERLKGFKKKSCNKQKKIIKDRMDKDFKFTRQAKVPKPKCLS